MQNTSNYLKCSLINFRIIQIEWSPFKTRMNFLERFGLSLPKIPSQRVPRKKPREIKTLLFLIVQIHKCGDSWGAVTAFLWKCAAQPGKDRSKGRGRTDHNFANVTLPKDAISLWVKLKLQRAPEWRQPDPEEEYKGSSRNVLNRIRRYMRIWKVIYLFLLLPPSGPKDSLLLNLLG